MLRTLSTSSFAPLRRGLHALRREEEGAHLVLLALMLTGLLGFAGLAIDGSNLYFQQQRMQIAADAAALGGARQLGLNADRDTVDSTVRHLATENYATSVNWNLTNGDRGVHVVAARNFEAFFAKIYGYDTFTVTAQSEARYEPVTGVDRLFPLTIDCDCEDEITQVPPSDNPVDTPVDEEEPPAGCGELYPIALSAQNVVGKAVGDTLGDIYNGVQPGNFGWLNWSGGPPSTPILAASLTPPGDSWRYVNPYNADDHVINIGDWVTGSPGVANASDVRAALDVLKTMEITVPVWDQAAGNGSNALYRVVNFARVQITDYRLPNENRITATFLGFDDSCSVTPGNSATIAIVDSQQFKYEISFLSHIGNTWSYQVRKIAGGDLSDWSLGINSCLSSVTGSTPSGTTGANGIQWTTGAGFESGVFSFTLDRDAPAGVVNAQVRAGSSVSTVPIRGPVCDGSGNGGGGTPAQGVCLQTLDFEADDAGASLLAGQIIDTEWAVWGIHATSSSPANHPAMIFDSANPTGNDPDLGSPHQDFGGPGRGIGGGSGKPGQNKTPQGKVLIVAESNNPAAPDDAAAGGSLIFTFDYPVRIDEVHVLDIDDAGAAGTVKAYSARSGGELIASSAMLGLGDNSFQIVPLDAANVRRLEVSLPKGGALANVVSCRSQQEARYRLGNLIWADTNSNGLQDDGESGIPGVALELYAAGQDYVMARTTTTTGGEYLFANLPAGSYEVKIAASNFAAGGALAGALYSPANSGADAKDSDFNAASGRAPAILPLNGGDNFTVDGGFSRPPAVEAGPESGVFLLSDSKNTAYEIRLISSADKTWTYQVKKMSGRDLKSWNLGIGACVARASVESTSPAAASQDTAGVKWAVTDSFVERTYTVTLDGYYAKGKVKAQATTTNNKTAEIDIAGPDCSQPLEEPPVVEEPPAPAPACSFSWVDWNGGTSSYQELRGDMADTRRSGTWYVGQEIQPGPPVSANVYTEAELANLVGKKVRIPLSKYNGSGFAICGFVEVRLTDYELQDGNRWMGLQWLTSLIRSATSDPDGPDFGLRDIRILRDSSR